MFIYCRLHVTWFSLKTVPTETRDLSGFMCIVIFIALSRMPEAADPLLSLSGGLRSRASEQSETPARRRMHRPQDCAVIVAWLERFEDRLEFPITELTASLHSPVSASSGYYSTLNKRGSDSTLPVVFIHPLSSGLYRISTHIASSR